MLIKLHLAEGRIEMEQAEPIPFATIPVHGASPAREHDLECLIAENVGLLESDTGDEESLLVVSRQATTTTRRRLDLVAIDNTGSLILVEIKRDADDVQARADHTEIQSVRYAAALAKLSTVDQLVRTLYEPYVSRYCAEELHEHGGGRTAAEWARKKLTDFLRSNDIEPDQLNRSQKIVLVGGSFDDDTKSAAAWMAANGIPIRVIELESLRIEDEYYINVRQLIPPLTHEDFYVDLSDRSLSATGARAASPDSSITRRYRPRMQALIDADKIRRGDEIWVEGHEDRKAQVYDGRECTVNGTRKRLNEWACDVTGWSSVNIYEWVRHAPTGKYIEQIRSEFEAEQEREHSPSSPAETARDDTN